MFYAILIFGFIFYTLYKIYDLIKEKERLEKEVEDSYKYMLKSFKKFKERHF